MKGVIDEAGDGKVLSKGELNLVFEKWSTLSTSTVDNLNHHAKVSLGGGGYIDNILKLKKGSKYNYIQDSKSLGQRSDLAYLFKMSTTGLGSGVDLVKRMQTGGNHTHQFIMFDHVKRIKNWTILGAHVYDPIHYKVMTIYICGIKSETVEYQKQMWRSLLLVMERHGYKKIEFARFMANSAEANFNVVWEIFGSRDKIVPMISKERTCQFHWSMALHKLIRQHIKPKLQAMHKHLCYEYQKCKSKAAADTAMEAIRA